VLYYCLLYTYYLYCNIYRYLLIILFILKYTCHVDIIVIVTNYFQLPNTHAIKTIMVIGSILSIHYIILNVDGRQKKELTAMSSAFCNRFTAVASPVLYEPRPRLSIRSRPRGPCFSSNDFRNLAPSLGLNAM